MATLENLALMGKEHYEKHVGLKTLGEVEGVYGEEVVKRFKEKSNFAVRLWKSGYKVFV